MYSDILHRWRLYVWDRHRQRYEAILITRFFSGFFGSAPVANTGGVMADIWQPRERGLPMAIYGVTLAGGPAIAPIIGGALCSAQSHPGWRWTEYLKGIVIVVQLAADVLLLDESYAPKLLVDKARRLRETTGNFALHAMVSTISKLRSYRLYGCVCSLCTC